MFTAQRPSGTHLPAAIPSPSPTPVSNAAIRNCLMEWWTQTWIYVSPATHSAAQAGQLLLAKMEAAGLGGRGTIAQFMRQALGQNLKDPRPVHKMRDALLQAQVLQPQDLALPLSPPAATVRPQVEAPTPPAAASAAPSPRPAQPTPQFSGLEPRFIWRTDEEKNRVYKQGAQALRQLVRSGRSICCLSASGIDAHGLLLGMVVQMIRDPQQIAPIAILDIFDSGGQFFLGLEDTPVVRRPLLDDDLTAEYAEWLDIVWDVSTLVRQRRRRRQRQTAGDRTNAAAFLRFDPALFVIPDWSFWVYRWKTLSNGARNAAVEFWIERRKAERNQLAAALTAIDQWISTLTPQSLGQAIAYETGSLLDLLSRHRVLSAHALQLVHRFVGRIPQLRLSAAQVQWADLEKLSQMLHDYCDPKMQFKAGDFSPELLIQDILKYGPDNAVRLLVTIEAHECGRNTGLTESVLAGFASVAVGQHLDSGAQFAACDKLQRLMDATTVKELAPDYHRAKELVRKTNDPLLLIHAGTPGVWAAPDMSPIFKQSDPALIQLFGGMRCA